MSRKCFISYKQENLEYKKLIQNELDIDFIDKSLNEPINSDDEDYIMRKIREDYLSDSTVTIHLIGKCNAENLGYEEQKYIKRELQASLFNGMGNTRSGILGVVLPEMYAEIYRGEKTCDECNHTHNIINISNTTTVKEFSYNYYIPKETGCSHSEEERYCILVKWKDFCDNPEKYIDLAFNKRGSEVSKKVKVRP